MKKEGKEHIRENEEKCGAGLKSGAVQISEMRAKNMQ